MPDLASIVRLRQELIRDMRSAEALLSDLCTRAVSVNTSADPVLLAYVAMTLHQIYTAVETALERIARTMEGSLPTGPDAHHALLDDMTLELPQIRPAVLQERTRDALRPLLRFRHFVRHSYAVAWDRQRLSEVLASAEFAWPALEADLRKFIDFLDALSSRSL